MVITMQQVLDVLDAYEPDYAKAAAMGPDSLPHLQILIETADLLLASKAAYMASLIQDRRSVSLLKVAARSRFPQVRSAAASGSRNLQIAEVDEILESLKSDGDEHVRKQAEKSIVFRRGR
jgi:hypothetical protein